MLEAKNLNKRFGRRKVINNLDLHISKGDIYGFLGPNGAGKTTTIRMLLGLIRYDTGSISINGYDLKREYKDAIIKVGAVVETPRFYEQYNAYDNLKLIKNLYKGAPRGIIEEVLELTGLTNRADDKVRTYSLGMKQRLGIARALINEPELVILDEPTNGLDPQGMKEIRELIYRLASNKKITFFISTHLLSEVELICNKVGIINNGTKIVEGYVSELLNSAYESIDAIVNDPVKAKSLLAGNLHIKSLQLIDGGIRLSIERGMTGEISRLLIENGLELKYLIPRPQSLEEYFIEKTGGGNQVV
ncbi:MAG: ABC transporter ATP-binding protein [Bacillota bacterium]